MPDKQSADIDPAENNIEVQSNAYSTGLNEETLSDALRKTLFADPVEQTDEAQSETEGEDQTEVKDDTVDEADNAEDTEEVPQAEDGDEVHSQEAQNDEGDGDLSKGVQKRIDKLTAKRKQAEEEVASLRKELDTLKQTVTESQQSSEQNNNSVNNADNPFNSLKSKAEVDKEVEQARWLRYKCMENPEGFFLGESQYGSDDVKRMLVNSTKAIEEHLPKQLAKIETENRIRPIAEANYPWWKTPASKEYQMAQQMLKTAPQLRNFPDWQIFIGDAIRGMQTREGQAKASSNNNSKSKSLPPVRSTAAPAKTNSSEVRAKQAESRFAKSNSADDLAKVLLAKGFI